MYGNRNSFWWLHFSKVKGILAGVLLWQLTDAGLKHLGQNCTNLRSLNLHGCVVWTTFSLSSCSVGWLEIYPNYKHICIFLQVFLAIWYIIYCHTTCINYYYVLITLIAIYYNIHHIISCIYCVRLVVPKWIMDNRALIKKRFSLLKCSYFRPI